MQITPTTPKKKKKNSILIFLRRDLKPQVPEEPLEPARDLCGPVVHHVAEEHEDPAEEEQADEGQGGDDGKGVPVRLAVPPLVQVLDLDGEVARHEADGEEEDAQLGQQRRAPGESRRRLGVLLLCEVEVLFWPGC
jgi:hypothetical protein